MFKDSLSRCEIAVLALINCRLGRFRLHNCAVQFVARLLFLHFWLPPFQLPFGYDQVQLRSSAALFVPRLLAMNKKDLCA